MYVAPCQLWLDFDQTVAWTFAPPVGGFSVLEACALAVNDILGPTAHRRYLASGGLHNRAPVEIVRDLVPEAEKTEFQLLAEAFVRAKLGYLTEQIGLQPDGTIWPPPCTGFVDFWRGLTKYLDAGTIHAGVISSGHTEFIMKVWSAYGLKPPRIIISEDDIRSVRYAIDPAWLVKPGVFPFMLGRRQLAAQLGVSVPRDWRDKSRVVYCGDDIVRDGEMARRAGVAFGHFAPGAEQGPTELGFRFGDWAWVRERLDAFVLTGKMQ